MENSYLTCPKCHSSNWNDIPNTKDVNNTKFKCFRCNYAVKIQTCKRCGQSKWEMTKGIDSKGGHRPFYRYKCLGCNRILKIKIY